MAAERVLVTGGAGFIGSHTVDLLVSLGMHVAVVDNLSSGRRECVHPAAEFYQVDVASAGLRSVIRRFHPTHVMHLAAQTSAPLSMQRPALDARVNAVGTLNVLECCAEQGRREGRPPKVLVACSAAIYGEPRYFPVDEAHPRHPQSFYGLHKSLILDYLRLWQTHHETPYTALVYANVYGPHQPSGTVLSRFMEAATTNGEPVIYGDGLQTRDFVFVGDVARANHLALDRAAGDIINISSGLEVSINELCRIVSRVTGRRLQPVYAPGRPGDISRSVLSCGKALQTLGWQPAIPLEEGVRLTVQDSPCPGRRIARGRAPRKTQK